MRDMVDALERSASPLDASDGEGCGGGIRDGEGAGGNGVFVTKHEVLMLRRLMGGA